MTTLEVALVGYVAVPEHILRGLQVESAPVHLLIAEPEHGTASTVMQVLKQRVKLPRENVAHGENPPLLDSKGAGFTFPVPS